MSIEKFKELCKAININYKANLLESPDDWVGQEIEGIAIADKDNEFLVVKFKSGKWGFLGTESSESSEDSWFIDEFLWFAGKMNWSASEESLARAIAKLEKNDEFFELQKLAKIEIDKANEDLDKKIRRETYLELKKEFEPKE
ncbi:hypothetical protein Xen7305DRAFT_00008810 [Xenococcus sp. PCC 7305]|uniref:hypothetical protein n=1 Tax=Xenococcus sp. PCC 7305 TaxID=102125 RepID=UPI0002AC86FB|nr:hypothetical protein [Xenococcus sp. PCC 7305]ELS01179.1 hypothetical protein Xen7305DRAFT_00008810 [Xenococcus sp. PCC 7305]